MVFKRMLGRGFEAIDWKHLIGRDIGEAASEII